MKENKTELIIVIKYYLNDGNNLKEIENSQPDCWIYVTNPTETEISELEEDMNIDRDYIRAALDEEEPSRIEKDEGTTLIILDYPIAEERGGSDNKTLSYYTTPMSIIITDKNVITVSAKENVVLDELAKGVVKGVRPNLKTQFVFTILLRIAARYLQYLRQIDKLSHYVEEQMYRSMTNQGLIQLQDLEKSLVYFSTSLKTSQTVLDKLMRGRFLKLYDEDEELLDDVIIEVKQATEMTNIYSNILGGTMDTFASMISNNLNIIMKRMTTITIIMTVPTIVFSFYGMNLGPNAGGLPLANIWFPIALSVLLSAAVGVIITLIQKFK